MNDKAKFVRRVISLIFISLCCLHIPAQAREKAYWSCEDGDKYRTILPQKGSFITGPQGPSYGRAIGDIIWTPFKLVLDVVSLPATIWTVGSIGSEGNLFMIHSRANYSDWFVERCRR
ncbi:hypothetical protein [Alcanivorax sp.]|uniref:hypothetical protein n=1 Tax=Alcanivorax sp. TaxID=1872427 RepID=UPI0026253748|nr:hypothetical protein [Alcanivorax sp.]